MEVDMLEKILYWIKMRLVESRVLEEKLACEGPIVFLDESFTLHHATYKKDSRNLTQQHLSVKGKQVIEKWGLENEINNVNPSDVMELYCVTGEALDHIVDDK